MASVASVCQVNNYVKSKWKTRNTRKLWVAKAAFNKKQNVIQKLPWHDRSSKAAGGSTDGKQEKKRLEVHKILPLTTTKRLTTKIIL